MAERRTVTVGIPEGQAARWTEGAVVPVRNIEALEEGWAGVERVRVVSVAAVPFSDAPGSVASVVLEAVDGEE